MHSDTTVYTGENLDERPVFVPHTQLVIETQQGGVRGLWMLRRVHSETGNVDLRLPNLCLPEGKVFDSRTEYDAFKQSGKDIVLEAEVSARKVAMDEAGVTGGQYTLLAYSRASLIELDLYFFLVQGGTIGDQELTEEKKRKITTCFVSYKDLQAALKTDAIQGDRSVAELYRYLDKLNLADKL